VFLDGIGPGSLEDCRNRRGVDFEESEILNRVSTKGGEIPKADYDMKMVHGALGAV
jgi:hypothetical protein